MGESIAQARAVLADILVDLTQAPSFVFLINSAAHYHQEFALCKRLGMLPKDYEALLVSANLATIDTNDKFSVLPTEWSDYLLSWHFDHIHKERPRFDMKRIHLDAAVNNTQIDRKQRSYIYSLQIGKDIGSSAIQNISQQLRQSKCPPPISDLRAKQRGFGRVATHSIVQALCNNERLYRRCMCDGEDRLKRKADDNVVHPELLSPPPLRQKTNQVAAESPPESSMPHIQANNINPSIEVTITDSCNKVLSPSPKRDTIECDKYPMLAKIQTLLGDEWNDERTQDIIFSELTQRTKDGSVVKVKDNKGKMHSWVRIPVNETDDSHRRRAKDWIKPILQINGNSDDSYDSARRMCNYLAVHHSDSMMSSLKEKQYPIVEYMNETRLAAMWEDAKVNFTQEGVLLKHLRQQFGPKTFATTKKVRMLCDGHTEVKTGKAKHAYEEGEREETLEYSYKSLKDELERQIAAKIQQLGLPLDSIIIKRVDIILGGDHGDGAFQFGVKVVIVVRKPLSSRAPVVTSAPPISIPTPKSGKASLIVDGMIEESIAFDIAIAEVICRKDNTEVLKKTIEPHIREGIEAITAKKLTIGWDAKGNVKCSFGGCDELVAKVPPPKIDMYMVGDLAFYALWFLAVKVRLAQGALFVGCRQVSFQRVWRQENRGLMMS
jgi:hypothetical protein